LEERNLSAKLKSSLVIVLVTLTLPLLIPLFNFRILVFNFGFYQQEFERHYVYYFFPDHQQVDGAAVELISYLAGKRDLTTDFFNQKEKGHLIDVKDLIRRTILAFSALLIIFVVSLTYLAITKRYRAIGSSFVLGGVASLALFVSIALLFQRWFFSLFLQFHLLAFDNYLWMLDPRTDNLIRMFPAGFFYDTVQIIARNSVVAAVLFVVFGVILLLALSTSITFRPHAVEPVENTAGDSSTH
jgi:integral membrane protein (TIGR01906 family)